VRPRATLKRRTTRADVARYAKVSTAVVSYVVNNGPRAVAPETAARVRDAIEVLDYMPNANARALRMGASNAIGLVLPDPTNPFFAEYAMAIEAAAALRGHVLVLASSRSDGDTERKILSDLAARHVDGVLVASVLRPTELISIGPLGLRTVVINSSTPVPGYPAIGAAARTGSSAAVNHLLAVHRYESVALIIGPSNDPVPEPREQGWSDAFRLRGLPPGPVVRNEFSRRGGYDAAMQILDWPLLPPAVFVASDQQCSGFLRGLRERGLACPRDVAVISYDGTLGSAYNWPALTVVRQPIELMAEAAVATVLEGWGPAEPYRQYDTELIIRESCGCNLPPRGIQTDAWSEPAAVRDDAPASVRQNA
jgi:LacI family transcriptional regulator